MDTLTKKDLKTLMVKNEGWCVSIFMPTHRTGPDTQQDPIRLANLLREAEEGLLARGLRTPEVKALMTPAQTLLEEALFWRDQSDGLAIFLSQETFRSFRLPLNFAELVIINTYFYLKPLLPLFSQEGMFYLLALSQNAVRLFKGTQYTINEIKLTGVPQSLAETLQYDQFDKQKQFHTATPSVRGRDAAIFHGHGATANEAKTEIEQYFRQIDQGLHKLLRNEQAPLILAAVDSHFPIYRAVNTYPYLLDQGITGNPDRLPWEKLQQRAWDIAQPYFQQKQQEARARYEQLVGQRASNQLNEIIPAAYHGQVETLFVAVDTHQWGTFDPATTEVQLRSEIEHGDEDLLDFAALQTLINGGTVYAMKEAEVPGVMPLAAIFRY